jgi:hypothetical protein
MAYRPRAGTDRPPTRAGRPPVMENLGPSDVLLKTAIRYMLFIEEN